MIMTVEEAKSFVNFKGWTDQKIELKLNSIEQVIRRYTNNNFQVRACRRAADVVGGRFISAIAIPFKVGDTVQVSESGLNAGLYTVATVEGLEFTVNEPVEDEIGLLVTRIAYPADIKEVVVNLLEWEAKHREKIGIKSETLSRHSVTYEDSASLYMGYPKGILGSLSLHMKARF